MTDQSRSDLTRFAWLSIAAAVATISLKAGAYYLTGSVGLLSDALESIINLVAALIALWVLKIAAQPPDEEHMFGHEKVEYFSSGIEGSLILIAALSIIYAAVGRLIEPQPLEQIGLGLAVSLLATVINLVVARLLLRAGRDNHSIVLEADGHHLMTDVWTSVGVIVGVAAVNFTGLLRLDPLIAILVAINIVFSGWALIRRSVHGLLDAAAPAETQEQIVAILARFVDREKIAYHALRTRQSGARKFIYLHVLVPGSWTVQKGHDLLEELEAELHREITNSVVFTHLEPLEDPVSYEDANLIRERNAL